MFLEEDLLFRISQDVLQQRWNTAIIDVPHSYSCTDQGSRRCSVQHPAGRRGNQRRHHQIRRLRTNSDMSEQWIEETDVQF